MLVYHSSLLVVSSWGHLASRTGAKAQCLRMVDFSQTSMLGMIIVFFLNQVVRVDPGEMFVCGGCIQANLASMLGIGVLIEILPFFLGTI